MVSDAGGGLAAVEGEGGQRSGRLTDVPLDGVEAIAAVGEVGGADVLAGGDEVTEALGDHRAERDAERQGAQVDVVVAAGRGVEVDAVVADADGVVEGLSDDLTAWSTGLF